MTQFLEGNQIEEWCRDNGLVPWKRAPRDQAPLMSRAYGQAVTPEGQEAEVATAVVEALGEWDECLLWVKQWGIWGCSEDWPKFYAERGTHGERRSLEKAPGHLFSWSERSGLLRFLQLVLENAWDAEVLSVLHRRSNGKRAFASHDEFVDVFGA